MQGLAVEQSLRDRKDWAIIRGVRKQPHLQAGAQLGCEEQCAAIVSAPGSVVG